MKPRLLTYSLSLLTAGAALFGALAPARAADPASAPATADEGKKPNILVIWGDDIGISNVSAYSDGLMGYETPNITFGEFEHEYIF